MNATDPVRLKCPKCSAAVRAPAALAGKRVKCPKCGGAIKVPGAVPSAGDDDDWLSLDDPLPKGHAGPAAVAGSQPAAASKARPADSPARSTPGRGAGPEGPSRPASARPPARSGGQSPAAGHPHGAGPATATGPVTATGPAKAGGRAGAGTPPEDDHDWLGSASALPSGTARPSGNAGLPPLSPAERAALASAGAFDLDDVDGPPGWDDADLGEEVPAADVQTETAVASEYRAKCPICASVLFVKPQQAGRTVRCTDCHSQFVVPPPPPPPAAKRKVDLDRVATFSLSEPAGNRDPFGSSPGAKSAAEYLREAEDAEHEEELRDQYDNPDMGGWLKGIFGIFGDPAVAAYWLMLSLLGALPGMVAVAIGHPVLMLISVVAAVVYGSLVVACGFAILETVAGGGRRVEEWPTFNPAEWIGQALTAIGAIAISGSPGLVLTYPLFGFGLPTVAAVMFTVYLLFPYVLLSMLDNGSAFMPVSSEVTKSVTRCKEAWGALYFSAMLLFFFQFLAIAVLSLTPPVAAVFFNCLLWVALVFVYFAMIGRLAFQIGQAINGDEEE